MKKISSLVAAAVISSAVLISGVSYAQQQKPADSGQGNGMKIAPVRNDLTIEKGMSQTVDLYVENITASTIRFKAITNDFVPSDDESGEPKIILDEDKSAPGNSFKSLVGKINSVSIEPNERKEVKVTLTVPIDASSGGYYGAVRFAPESGQGGDNVSLTASVGSIFLVRVPGEITEKLSVESFGVSKEGDGNLASLFSSGPVTVEARFRNMGNIHVQPFGKMVVKNMSGKVVEEIEINDTQPRGSVLPASVRKFSAPIKVDGVFGRYTVEANFGYGGSGDMISASKTFYVIPYQLIGVVGGLILFTVFGAPRILKSYNSRVIEKSKRGK